MPKPKSPAKPRGRHIQVWLDPIADAEAIKAYDELCGLAAKTKRSAGFVIAEALKLLAANKNLIEYLPPTAPPNVVESRLLALVNQVRDLVGRINLGGYASTQIEVEAFGEELDEIAASFASSMNEFEIEVDDE